MYKDAIDKTPLSEKVEEIQNKENYTKITDMPKIYLDAVISIEDHKFYKHHGVSVTSIVRAFLHDIDAKDMTDSEATLLAGIPNAPSVYNPKENLKLAKERQKQVLDKMVQYKKITKEKEDEILSKE